MKRLVVVTIVLAALGAPSAAFAGGVVLKVQQATHLVAVTHGNKKVALVHTKAAGRLHVGQRVAMRTRTLRNGTLAASSVRVLGRARTVHFRGLLLAKTSSRFVVSAGGAVISVKRGSRTLASATDGGPSPGSTVDVTATVRNDDELDEDNVTTVSATSPGGSIEGALTIGTGKITVVSEHMALVINVPTGFDLSSYKDGDEVLAVFAQQPDGTMLLTSLSADENAQQADEQGDDDQSSSAATGAQGTGGSEDDSAPPTGTSGSGGDEGGGGGGGGGGD
jgi:hypothetical protein